MTELHATGTDQEVIEEHQETELENPQEKGVIDHLDLAVLAAEREGVAMSELIGMFFYYAHNLSHQARTAALAEEADDAD